MKNVPGTAAAVCLLAVASLTWMGASSSSTQSRVERGKYLVEGVAGCRDCHTPMDEKGARADCGTGLAGRAHPVQADDAGARLGGEVAEHRRPARMGYTDAVKFLMTGIAFNGLPARPPMPQYWMNKEDAEAVVAYLRSRAPADK